MENDLKVEVAGLRAELSRLNSHRFVELHNRPGRLLWFRFLNGLAFGLGSVLGATILVSVIGYALSSIEFIPMIGEWARQIAEEMAVGR